MSKQSKINDGARDAVFHSNEVAGLPNVSRSAKLLSDSHGEKSSTPTIHTAGAIGEARASSDYVTTAEAARRIGVDPSRIRHNLSDAAALGFPIRTRSDSKQVRLIHIGDLTTFRNLGADSYWAFASAHAPQEWTSDRPASRAAPIGSSPNSNRTKQALRQSKVWQEVEAEVRASGTVSDRIEILRDEVDAIRLGLASQVDVLLRVNVLTERLGRIEAMVDAQQRSVNSTETSHIQRRVGEIPGSVTLIDYLRKMTGLCRRNWTAWLPRGGARDL